MTNPRIELPDEGDFLNQQFPVGDIPNERI